MKAKSLASTLCLLSITLTGCTTVNVESAPEKAESSSQSPASSAASESSSQATESEESEAAQPAPTQQTAESQNTQQSQAPQPPVSLPSLNSVPGKTNFVGTTLKGNDIQFIILPESEQNNLSKTNNLEGSWGLLCSSMATTGQLSETGVVTMDDAAQQSVWRALKYANQEEGANAGESSMGSDDTCITLHSADPLAGIQGYTRVTIGQYVGGTNLENSVVIN